MNFTDSARWVPSTEEVKTHNEAEASERSQKWHTRNRSWSRSLQRSKRLWLDARLHSRAMSSAIILARKHSLRVMHNVALGWARSVQEPLKGGKENVDTLV